MITVPGTIDSTDLTKGEAGIYKNSTQPTKQKYKVLHALHLDKGQLYTTTNPLFGTPALFLYIFYS
jgi:hypothetical protein